MSMERLPLVRKEISFTREAMEPDEVTSRANVETPAEERSFMCEVERAVAKMRKEPMACKARASAEPRDLSEQPVMRIVRVGEDILPIPFFLAVI